MRNDEHMSDKHMLMDLLLTSKYMSHLYDHSVLEASHGDIRDTFEQLQQDEHDTAELLYSTMQNFGWYQDNSYPRAGTKGRSYTYTTEENETY